MRTAEICPTCATYINALCVIYDGDALPNTQIGPNTNMKDALSLIDASIGTINHILSTGYTGVVETGFQTLTFTNGMLTSVI